MLILKDICMQFKKKNFNIFNCAIKNNVKNCPSAHASPIYRSRTFGFEFSQNRLMRYNVFNFEFKNKNCLTYANFELSSLNFVDGEKNTLTFSRHI